jgi:hypothetical protein
VHFRASLINCGFFRYDGKTLSAPFAIKWQRLQPMKSPPTVKGMLMVDATFRTRSIKVFFVLPLLKYPETPIHQPFV